MKKDESNKKEVSSKEPRAEEAEVELSKRSYRNMYVQHSTADMLKGAVPLEFHKFKFEDVIGRIYQIDELKGEYIADKKPGARIKPTVNNARTKDSAVGYSNKKQSYKQIPLKFRDDEDGKRAQLHQVIMLRDPFALQMRAGALERAGEGGVINVNHGDMDTLNNRICNIEWTTARENTTDAKVKVREQIADGMNHIVPCKSGSKEFNGKLYKPVFITETIYPEIYGDYFTCGVSYQRVGDQTFAEYYSDMLSEFHLPHNTDAIRVDSLEGVAEIQVAGVSIWMILAEMHKVVTKRILEYKVLGSDEWFKATRTRYEKD